MPDPLDALTDDAARILGGNRAAALALTNNPGVAISLIRAGADNEVKRLRARLTKERTTLKHAEGVLRDMEDEPDAAARRALSEEWQVLAERLRGAIARDEAALSHVEQSLAANAASAPEVARHAM